MNEERPSSVWEGTDADLLEWMIPFYSRQRPKYDESDCILDATWGNGRFWKDSRVVGIDLQVKTNHPHFVIADNRFLPFKDGEFTVVVYDPPHMTDVGATSVQMKNYESGGRHDDISYLFPEFLAEAYRVLSPGGIVLAKIADQVHGGKSRWQHVDFMLEATKAGFTVCDLIVKIRKAAIPGRWNHIHHARKRHSFWIICRKGLC